jgi:hypothetical protein
VAHQLTADERILWERDGFVIRRGVLAAPELDQLRAASEDLERHLVAVRRGRRVTAGSYTFEADAVADTMIKWEGDSAVMHGIEPVSHLHPVFDRYGLDPRFTEMAASALGLNAVGLFTEKLNFKRAREGRAVILHQDYPYWVDSVANLDCILTTMVLLDDSTMANGCLQVGPGSHRLGVQKMRDVTGFGQFEMDPDAFDLDSLVPVELDAGDLVMFGPLLVHYSAPNTSDRDRRAMLWTYQEPEQPHTLVTLRSYFETNAARNAAT